MSIRTSKYLDWRYWLGQQKEEVKRSPPTMTIAAIIPAYNEAEYIATTIKSLLKQTYPLTQIIVVDDSSSDETGSIARSYGVSVYRTPENQGTKSQAQNFGLQHVTADLFVTIDADTMLAHDAIYEAMRYFNDPDTEVVCGTVVPQRIKSFWEYGRLIDYLYAQSIMKSAQNQNNNVLVASGCFSIFRTETARNQGGFNERTMAEDMDLTWTILNEGGRVYYAGNAKCYPIDPPTRRIYFNQMDRWYRGFVQNMKVRSFRPFPNKMSMRVMVCIYLVWFAISALITPLLLFSITRDIQAVIIWTLILNGVLVWSPAFIWGVAHGVKWWKILLGFFPHLILPYINMFLYARSLWRELVMKNKLTVWQKGH